MLNYAQLCCLLPLGEKMSIDANLVTAQWGLVGAFGVAVTLLTPKADQYREEYVQSGSDHDRKNADKWVRFVRVTPVAVLAAVILLTVLAGPTLPLSGKDERQDYSLLLFPILAQVGFIYILWRLIPSLSLPLVRLAPPKPDSDSVRKCSGSQQNTFMRVVNKSDNRLSLWWLNEKGVPVDNEERLRIGIPAGGELSIATKAGDWWLVRSQYGWDVGYFQAGDEPVVGKVDQHVIDILPPPQVGELLPASDMLPVSRNTDGNAAITVFNGSDKPISLCWIDGNGVPRNSHKIWIPPGTERTVWTWAGHYWLVRTQADKNVGLVQAKDKPTKTTVGQQAVYKCR
jgi:hypothetical protein